MSCRTQNSTKEMTIFEKRTVTNITSNDNYDNNDIVGYVCVYLDNKEIYNENIYISVNKKKNSIKNFFKKLFKKEIK